jgi:glycerol-3-phosphate dehydrogenase (NAD(P)+)
MSRIAVIGSGAWGTALALSLARKSGHTVTLWAHAQDVCDVMREHRENVEFLPGFPIPQEIVITADTEETLRDADIVISVMPSQFVRSTYRRISPYLREHQILVSATKGIEDETYLRMSQVIDEVLAERGLVMPCGVMSGPSFAREVASTALRRS